MKNPIDTIRNQIHDLPACSAVPQPTVPPCVPLDSGVIYKLGQLGVCRQRQKWKGKYMNFLYSSQHGVWYQPAMEMGQCHLI